MEKFLHAFNLVEGMHYVVLAKIWRSFGDWEIAWESARIEDYVRAGITQPMAEKICETRGRIDVGKEFKLLWEQDVVMLMRGSREYPESLRSIPASPFLLYRKGAPLRQNARNVSIVGTRLASSYGEKMTLKIAETIALNGGVIVSGLAFGIDAVAHFAAVKNGLPTVAVLASGVNCVTPASHNSLANKILENGGTLLSEYAGKVSFKDNFLWRNRIISGLSRATIVIEAKEKSGALITAKHAADQRRDVYALVGDLTRPQARGCLKLIRDGNALAIVDLHELMALLGFEVGSVSNIFLTKDEQFIVNILHQKPSSTEELLEETLLPLNRMNAALIRLELKSAIKKNRAFLWEALIP